MKYPKMKDPIGPIGCYSLDLYCCRINPAHSLDEFPHQFTAETGSKCRSKARSNGWTFHRDFTATCPKCNGFI
jgi:hypothetical protein